MSSWGRPTHSQHSEGRGTPLRASTARKVGSAAASTQLDADIPSSNPSTPTRARRSAAPAPGQIVAKSRRGVRSSVTAALRSSQATDPGPSTAVAHHELVPSRGTRTTGHNSDSEKRIVATHASAAAVTDDAEDFAPPSVRASLRHTHPARQRVLDKVPGARPTPPVPTQGSFTHSVDMAKPPSTPSRPRPPTGIPKTPTESHTPSLKRQAVPSPGGPLQRSSGGGYAQLHQTKSALPTAVPARPTNPTPPPHPFLQANAPEPGLLPAPLQPGDTSFNSYYTPFAAGSISSGGDSGLNPDHVAVPNSGSASQQEGDGRTKSGAQSGRSGTVDSSSSGATPGSISSSRCERRLSRGRATPEHSMVPASALLSCKKPITPEAEAALAELKAEALSARRASAGASMGGCDPSHSDQISGGCLHRALSFQEDDATYAGDADADADNMALNIEMGSLAVSDVAQHAAESALASLEARIASMAGPALAALGSASGASSTDLSTAVTAADLSLSAQTDTDTRETGSSDAPLPRGNRSGSLTGKLSSGQVRASIAVGAQQRSLHINPVTGSARVPVNRKAGARGSADRRAAHAAAELHKDDKENDTSVLAGRSSSEKNSMNSQDSSGGSAERHRDPEQGVGLSCGVGGSGGGQIKAGVSKSAHSPPRSAIDQQWRSRQLQRLQAAFRSALAGDVAALKAAVQQYREQVARLQCQKQLLLNQVLRLEALEEDDEAAQVLLIAERDAAIADAAEARAEAKAHMLEAAAARTDAAAAHEEAAEAAQEATAAAEQRRAARAEAATAGRQTAAPNAELWGQRAPALAYEGSPVMPELAKISVSSSPPIPNMYSVSGGPYSTESPSRGNLQGMSTPRVGVDTSDDSWASTPTVETMLPKIVELWERLHVPLVHRSRFFLSFRGREIFYYEAEHRRLAWLAKQLDPAADVEPAGGDMESSPVVLSAATRAAQRKLEKALRRLEWERKFLAAQLKLDFDKGDKEELFLAWNVHRESKERKMQLVRKLWAPDTTWDQAGMQRSSNLVMRLNGSEPTPDTADDAYEMVFSRSEGNTKWRSMLATGSTMLAPLLGRAAPRHSLLAGPGSALQVDQRRSSSFMGSFTSKMSRLSPGPSQLGAARASNANTPLPTGIGSSRHG